MIFDKLETDPILVKMKETKDFLRKFYIGEVTGGDSYVEKSRKRTGIEGYVGKGIYRKSKR